METSAYEKAASGSANASKTDQKDRGAVQTDESATKKAPKGKTGGAKGKNRKNKPNNKRNR